MCPGVGASQAVDMCAVVRRATAVLLAVATLGLGLPALLPQVAQAAHVRPAPEASWGVDGPVLATAVAGNVVVVGGRFSTAVGPSGERVPRANLAAFSLRTGALLTGWRADTNSTVRALTTDGRSLWVGGSFTRVGGVARARVAKVWAHWGVVDKAFRADADAPVLALEHSGKALFLGGDFTTVAGTTLPRLARVRAATGRPAPRFRPSVNRAVQGIAVSGNRVYLAGQFTALGGQARRGVGAVARATGVLRGPAYAASVHPSFGVEVSADGSRLLVAAGEYANALVAWDATSGAQLFRHTAMGDVQALDVQGDHVYFGFHEGFGGDTNLKVLAARVSTGELDRRLPAVRRLVLGHPRHHRDPRRAGARRRVLPGGGVTARGWARFRD